MMNTFETCKVVDSGHAGIIEYTHNIRPGMLVKARKQEPTLFLWKTCDKIIEGGSGGMRFWWSFDNVLKDVTNDSLLVVSVNSVGALVLSDERLGYVEVHLITPV